MYLKDLVDIQMGQSPDSKFYNNDKIGLPFYQGKADFGRINPIPKIWCSKSKKEAKPNDILISVRAPVGDLNINNEQSCIGRGLAAITCKSDVDMMYLYYHLKYLKPQLRHISTGSTFESINRSQLENLIIDYKPYSEQIKISNILQVVQRQIEVREKLLRLYDLLIKSRFVEMFGDIRESGRFKVKKWKDVVDIFNGKDYKTVQVDIGGYPVYGSGGIIARASEYICPAKTIIIGRKGSINNPILVNEKFWNVDTAFGIVPRETIDTNYLFYFCKQYNFNHLNKATTLPSLTKRDLLEIEINIPSFEEQETFSRFVNQINKLKSDVQKSIDETQLLMDSLMQEYFG